MYNSLKCGFVLKGCEMGFSFGSYYLLKIHGYWIRIELLKISLKIGLKIIENDFFEEILLRIFLIFLKIVL